MKRRNHKDLVVWQKAMSLARTIHVLTRSFPPEELFGITSQLRRAAVSIPGNIAEGAARATTREFIQFLICGSRLPRGDRDAARVGRRRRLHQALRGYLRASR